MDENVRTCPYCGEVVNGTAEQCPKCKALLPKEKKGKDK